MLRAKEVFYQTPKNKFFFKIVMLILNDKEVMAAKSRSKVWVLKPTFTALFEDKPCSRNDGNMFSGQRNEKAGEQKEGREDVFYCLYKYLWIMLGSKSHLLVDEALVDTKRRGIIACMNKIQPNGTNLQSFLKILWRWCWHHLPSLYYNTDKPTYFVSPITHGM